MLFINCKVMKIVNKKYELILFLLYVMCCYSYAACPSLTSTVTTNVTCKYDNKTLKNCITPIEGTMACLSCNEFYEENTIEKYPCRLCRNNNWNAPIPSCYPICGKRLPKQRDQDGNKNNTLLEYPWHVGIYSEAKSLLCSGALIAMNVVFTDVACFSGYSDLKQINKTVRIRKIIDSVTVASGKNYRQYFDKRDKFQQFSKLNDIFELEDISITSLGYFLAILILADPFLPSQVVQPVCISFLTDYDWPESGLITNWNSKHWNGSELKNEALEVVQEIQVKFIQIFGYSTIDPNNTDVPLVFDELDDRFNVIQIDGDCDVVTRGSVVFKNSSNHRYYVTGINSIQPRLVSETCQDTKNYNFYYSLPYYEYDLDDYINTTNNIRYCALPKFPPNGKYVFINRSDELAYEPGYPVPSHSILTLICNSGYNLNSSSKSDFTCSKHGQWTPTPTDCTNIFSTCPSLTSTESTTVTCKYDNKTLKNCITPIEGTMACLSCNEFYEENTVEKYPCRYCRNNNWNAPIPSCYPICGKRLPKQRDQDGNKNNTLLEYPWHVGIYSEAKSLLCSRALIAMNVVFTDVACFSGYSDLKQINKTVRIRRIIDSVTVASGKNYRQYFDKRDKFQQFSKLNDIFELEDTSFTSLGYFVAILILADPFLPSQVVQPVCISFTTDYAWVEYGLITNWNSKHWNGSELKNQALEVVQEIQVKFIQYSGYDIKDSNDIDVPLVFDALDDRFNIIQIDVDCDVVTRGSVVFKNSSSQRYYVTGINSIQPRLVSENCQDTKNFNFYYSLNYFEDDLNDYINTTKNIRYCALPKFPPNGKYVFINRSDELAYEPGYPVPSHSILTLICNSGYNLNSSSKSDFTCSEHGQWTPTPTDCTIISLEVRTLELEGNKTDLINNNLDLINKTEKFENIYIILIVAVIIFFVVALVAVILLKLKFNKKKKLRRELKMAGLDCFQYGNLKRFNPELGIDDQAELLPYNTNYEFPRNKLELGQQLGSGAFGIVLKAEAFGIILNEEKTTVAVKTVKSTVDDIHMKALVSELKIMIHLGQHLNVVNLLGACTQNIIKRELLVIVEYCRFGNLYNYLLQNRSNYIDQIDSLTGNIDYSFGLEDLKSVAEVYNSPRTSQELDLNNFSSLNSIKNGVLKLGNNLQDSYKLLYTKDLVSWSFQIARGMEYLASKKIFHGDLAARNILLAENNIVKICDFGLAKRIYRTTNYKKNKNFPLPIKWMAIESIRDLIFSTKSDVWSYGIVLWELFSLAQTPYPGMESDEKLYQKLLTGYRMESPSYAPKELYKIMCDCWNIDPLSRPCFNKLAGAVGLLLEENIRQFYIDLNDPYFVMNTQRLTEDPNDYLVMLSAPDAIATPKYLSIKPTYLAVHQDESISDSEQNMNIHDNLRNNHTK